MASLTAFTMSLLWTCCHAIFGLSQKVQIKVSCRAPSVIMSIVREMSAQTGQHGFLFFIAWWDKVWPWWLFFWLSTVIDTRSTFQLILGDFMVESGGPLQRISSHTIKIVVFIMHLYHDRCICPLKVESGMQSMLVLQLLSLSGHPSSLCQGRWSLEWKLGLLLVCPWLGLFNGIFSICMGSAAW